MSSRSVAHITGVAIKLAISKRSFSVTDIQTELKEEKNHEEILPVLQQLEADGWVEEDISSPFERWHSGPRARKYGNTVKFSNPEDGIVDYLPDERYY